MQEPMQTQRSSNCLLIVLLLFVFVAAVLYALAQMGGSGSSFDATPYALQIARKAYQVRKHHTPTGHDFGGGIIIVQYIDGSTPSIIESDIYEGYNSPPPDVNKTHSERRTQDDFILPTLAILKRRGTLARVSEIDVIIFTQFYPCDLCLAEMRAWQNQDRQAAGMANVYMTVWTLVKPFSPLDRNPRKRVQPVIRDEQDIQEVPIPFDSPSAPVSRKSHSLTVEHKFSTIATVMIVSPKGEEHEEIA